jgi:hypothetical protein
VLKKEKIQKNPPLRYGNGMRLEKKFDTSEYLVQETPQNSAGIATKNFLRTFTNGDSFRADFFASAVPFAGFVAFFTLVFLDLVLLSFSKSSSESSMAEIWLLPEGNFT